MSVMRRFIAKRIEQRNKCPELPDIESLRTEYKYLVENGGERGTDSQWTENEETVGRSGASTS